MFVQVLAGEMLWQTVTAVAFLVYPIRMQLSGLESGQLKQQVL